MTRAILPPLCALGLLLGAGASDARRGARVVAPAATKTAVAPAATVKPTSTAVTTPKQAPPKRELLRPPTVARAQKLGPNARLDASAKPAPIAKTVPDARPAPRIRVKDALSKLPSGERRQMIALIASPRTQVPVRRAVAAYLVLRGLKGGARLPVTLADLQQMSTSKHWTAKRMQNFAIVLRTAVGIAQAEGISANAAFQKALKVYGIQKKYNRGVCGA